MSSYLDKYRTGNKSYLIYCYRGEIKVQRGYDQYGTFVLDNQNRWMSKTPYAHNIVSSYGKIIVDNEENIPQAAEKIKQHYIDKINDIEHKAVASLNNIQKMIIGGAI